MNGTLHVIGQGKTNYNLPYSRVTTSEAGAGTAGGLSVLTENKICEYNHNVQIMRCSVCVCVCVCYKNK